MRVMEILTQPVASAPRRQPLLEAISRMRDEHVGAMVIVEERGGVRVPVGMLTDRDIVVGVFAKDVSHAKTLEVGDVMTPDPVTATADEDLGAVLRRMRKFGVRRVPVVDAEGGLKGLISIDDVFAALSDELAQAATLVARQREHEPARRP